MKTETTLQLDGTELKVTLSKKGKKVSIQFEIELPNNELPELSGFNKKLKKALDFKG